MATQQHAPEPLIFAWGVRDHSTWYLVLALLVLMGGMAGFFFIFRIVYPVTERLPTTPQHVIALDPRDPAALALIHRAQDRSFALLSEGDATLPAASALLAFQPSFAGYQLKLREMAPVTTEMQPPRLFTATASVLPPVARRATGPVAAPPVAQLHAIMSSTLAKRGPASVVLPDIKLTQPARVQFRVAIGGAGQIITALPLGSAEDVEVMDQLSAAVSALRFEASAVKGIEWGEISFRWEAPAAP